MDPLAPVVLTRLPLAEAALHLWRFIADEQRLQALFERYRGRCYDHLLTFPTIVHLIADALLEHRGNACRAFQQARHDGTLTVSLAAAYGKLRRLPVELSMGFLAECTDQLQALLPPRPAVVLPQSLDHLAVLIYDGKAIKRVAKRLRALHGVRGSLLGGRALVALHLRQGLAIAMHAHPDGEVNDVRFVPDLLPVVRQRVAGPRLHVADAQFGDLKQTACFAQDGDHFLVRYHPKVKFVTDPAVPVRRGVNADGRSYREEWGWLGREDNRERRYVRRITLERPAEKPLVLVTSLLDADVYPAADLLEVYRRRWGIEQVFQQVTEVFGLEGLIGSSPEATVFQFSFCLVLYNLIQVMRAYVAQAQDRPTATISTEKLFEDVTRQLVAWNEVIEPASTVALFAAGLERLPLCHRLAALLGSVWHEYWIKSPARPRRCPKEGGRRSHGSVYRVLEAHRRRLRPGKSGDQDL